MMVAGTDNDHLPAGMLDTWLSSAGDTFVDLPHELVATTDTPSKEERGKKGFKEKRKWK